MGKYFNLLYAKNIYLFYLIIYDEAIYLELLVKTSSSLVVGYFLREIKWSSAWSFTDYKSLLEVPEDKFLRFIQFWNEN